MKRDLEIAREIQSWLVPSQAPEVAGADIAFATRPQNSVAGDYYDAFYPDPENRERLVVVIADVAGKRDRKSTRLNSSHGYISYSVFCLKKKNKYSTRT